MSPTDHAVASRVVPAPGRPAPLAGASGAPAVAVTGTVGAPSPTLASVNALSLASAHVAVLARALVRPLSAGDGTYRVEVALHPAELGALQAVISLRGADLHVQLSPQTRQGHDVLARDAEALKTALSRDGLAVSVTVRDPSQHASGERRALEDRGPRARRVAPTEVAVVTRETVATGGQIHLLL